MFSPGDLVRVQPPFDESYGATYDVTLISTAEDGQTIIYLEGIESAFAPEHLEPAA